MRVRDETRPALLRDGIAGRVIIWELRLVKVCELRLDKVWELRLVKVWELRFGIVRSIAMFCDEGRNLSGEIGESWLCGEGICGDCCCIGDVIIL